ncbi:hypothetical protein AAFF_G00051550 [Aldrovandia affinis]|uniref:Uncharacterized protein n=1 Tax=Aldrovandia affinis TaxID=143900 RepID=A0AAD7WZ27_9TELE|nr:hypothetical protein AAFF_G00051550 [Aldrovandia affinis]
MKQVGVNQGRAVRGGRAGALTQTLLQFITFVPEEWRPSPHLLFWFAVVTFFVVIGLSSFTTNCHIPASPESPLLCALESEKGYVELRTETLQQRLEAHLTLQQTLDSENNDRESKVKEVIRTQTREMQVLKRELEQTENLFKTEMDVHIVEQNLEVEREESEILRKNVQLEEIKSPLFVTSVKKGEVLLNNRKILIKDKLNLEIKNKRALGELQNMIEQWQQMDQALQQKAAEVESDRRDKEMEVKALLRFHKLKVDEIEEEHVRAEISYEAEVSNYTCTRATPVPHLYRATPHQSHASPVCI